MGDLQLPDPEAQRENVVAPAGAAARPGLAMGPAIPPLNVTGLVVAKADLVAALRLYVPQLGDISALEGDRFLLTLTMPNLQDG